MTQKESHSREKTTSKMEKLNKESRNKMLIRDCRQVAVQWCHWLPHLGKGAAFEIIFQQKKRWTMENFVFGSLKSQISELPKVSERDATFERFQASLSSSDDEF